MLSTLLLPSAHFFFLGGGGEGKGKIHHFCILLERTKSFLENLFFPILTKFAQSPSPNLGQIP